MQEFYNIKEFMNEKFLILLICLWVFWLWSRRDLYRFAWKFPGSFGLPIIGSYTLVKDIKNILGNITAFIERCKSNTICVWMGLHPTMITSDPEFIEKILKSSELLNKSLTFYAPLHKALQGGLLTNPAKRWQHERKLINPSFQHKVLLSFLPVFHKGKLALISKMDKMVGNDEHYLSEVIKHTILSITAETTMGKVMNANNDIDVNIPRYVTYVLEKTYIHIALSCLNLDLLSSLNFKFEKTAKKVRQFIYQLVEEKLMQMETDKDKSTIKMENEMESLKKSPNIFIDQAIKIVKQQKLSYNDMLIDSYNIVSGAFETTTNTIFSVLLMLAVHPEIQERLFDEIVNIFPERDFEMQYEQLDQLPYLDMVINETLRVAPPVPIIGRFVAKDFQMTKNLILPKKLQILVFIYGLHRRKDLWGPNADNFNPDNFLPANMTGRHPYSFIPFSKGMRNCIGWRYGLFLMKVIIAGIVRNYRLTTATKYEDIQFYFYTLLKYKNKHSFTIHRRN